MTNEEFKKLTEELEKYLTTPWCPAGRLEMSYTEEELTNYKKCGLTPYPLQNWNFIPYFHNYEYRHLLRSVGDYREFKKLKKSPSVKWWNNKYLQIKAAFEQAGLEVSGFSVKHTKLIEKILYFKPGVLITVYHREESSK